MGKIILSTLISILPFTQLSHPHEEDPFTTYIQEKLIELGYLEVANGVNDKTSQAAIKLFQEKSGLIVDGMVGESTFLQLMLTENSTDNNSLVTTSSAEDIVIDDKPPVWNEEQPPYASEIGSLFNLNMPSVTDNVGLASYEVYVNGALSTYATITDSTLLVTPKYDMTCGDQFIYVIAFDEAGNSSQSPTFTIPQTDPCTSTVSTSQSSSSSQISSQSFAVSFGGDPDSDAQSIVVDSVGNTYVTGAFRTGGLFGGTIITSGGHRDIYVAKLDPTGAFEWVKTYGSYYADRAFDIDIDSSSNVYITGYFQQTVDFGSGNITSAGGSDIFVLKLNSSGTFQWVYTAGGTGNDNGKGIAVDTDGNILLTGMYSDTVDFGSGNVTSQRNFDIFALKLNSSGTFQWVYTAGGGYDDEEGLSIDTDSNNNSYITGYVEATVDFGVNVNAYGYSGLEDIFVLKLNSSGTPQWVNRYGSCSNEMGHAIAVDSSGNSYITGQIYDCGSYDFGGKTVTTSGSGVAFFVLKLDSSGVSQWVYTPQREDPPRGSGANDDQGNAIAIDSSGNVYITGSFSNTVDFGGGNVSASFQWELYVLKLNSSGSFEWVFIPSGTNNSYVDYGLGIAVDSSGNVYFSGTFYGNIELASGVTFTTAQNNVSRALVFKLNSSGQYSD